MVCPSPQRSWRFSVSQTDRADQSNRLLNFWTRSLVAPLIISLHTGEPGHSHRREHVIYASVQVNVVIVASAVGKVVGHPLTDDRLQLIQVEEGI